VSGPDEIVELLRSMLHNAAAREWAASKAAPATPSPEYLTGYAAGWEGGELAALALAVSAVSGETATSLVEEARARAAVDSAFPFDLVVQDSGAEAGDEAGEEAA
jgi:hypothetical protein